MPEAKRESLRRDLNALIAETRALAAKEGPKKRKSPLLVEPEEVQAGKGRLTYDVRSWNC